MRDMACEAIYTPSFIEELTEREREILSKVAQGASNRQIAEALYVRD